MTASPLPGETASPAAADTPRVAGGDDAGPVCSWCKQPIATWRPGMRFCTQGCRQRAFRVRRRYGAVESGLDGRPLRLRYYDPPYPGKAWMYKGESTYAGEVDHAAMIATAELDRAAGVIDGYAVSTSERALRMMLSIMPPEAHVCPWVKPGNPAPATFGLHNMWEPLIVVGGRAARGGVQDWLSATPAKYGGTLPGRKPIAFCAFLFRVLGMRPGDTVEDMYPGTGVVSASWEEISTTLAIDAVVASTSTK